MELVGIYLVNISSDLCLWWPAGDFLFVIALSHCRTVHERFPVGHREGIS